MIVYLNAINDVMDAASAARFCYVRHIGLNNRRIIPIESGTEVDEIVDRIIRSVAGRHSIWRLIINAHGAEGVVCVGEYIGIHNVEQLSRLRDYFSINGEGIMIDACGVGFGTAGENFLKRFASSVGQKVIAPLTNQISYPSPDWDYGHLEGEILAAYPNQTVQRYRDYSVPAVMGSAGVALRRGE